MRYRISHITDFNYSLDVAHSRQLLHMTPRATDQQRIIRSELRTQPVASHRESRADYFGNHTTDLQFQQTHQSLQISASSIVEVLEKQDILLDLSPNWETVAQQLSEPSSDAALAAAQFVYPSPWIDFGPVFALSAEILTPGKALLRAAMDVTERIYTDFEYRGGVTDVYTPIAEVLRTGRGVCQDFAHLAIACLRAKGLAARYVSGYLLTHPPQGKPKLVGADASHAWLSVWCPEFGWVDFDPTNNLRPSNEHIQVAWGRDYGDVSPIKGVIHGGGKQRQRVAVDVSPY